MNAAAAVVPYSDQLAAAQREVKMRERVYPRWVQQGKMTQAKADAELAAMRAICATLEPLAASERLL